MSSILSSILNTVHLKYTIIPSVFLSFIAVISTNPDLWAVSDVHHFYFEMFAVVLSAIVAFYCITRAYALNEKFSLFVGIGFLTISVIDFLHATLSFGAAGNSEFLKYFIPQTWFAGRTFLGAMLVIAVIKYASTNLMTSNTLQASVIISNEKETTNTAEPSSSSTSHQIMEGKLRGTLLFSLVMLAVLAIFVVVISFFTIFPGIVTDYALSRPYEIPSLVLFSIALLYFYKKKLYKADDVFYKGMLGALIIDIFGQIIMSYSATNFQTAHNVAHILKDSAYFLIVISLAVSSIQHNKIAKQRAEIIRFQYNKLKEADKMKDEFINIAAHELRTPIQPMLGLSELLRSKVKDNAEQREILEVIIRNAKRLHRLTENILDVTKIESQSLDLKIERFDLNEVISNVVDDAVASMNSKKRETVRILYQPNHIFVDVDKVRLTQVISNLITNAIKFTSEGSVLITTKESNGKIVISVQDTGQGLDPEILPKLFTRFVSDSSSGTGLGLFISKSIVEAHGGKIWAENNAGKSGATFAFTLPAANQKQLPAPLCPETTIHDGGSKKEK